MNNNYEAINVGIIGGGYMGKAHAVAARAASANAELGVDIRLEGLQHHALNRPRTTKLSLASGMPSNLPRRCSRTIISMRSS